MQNNKKIWKVKMSKIHGSGIFALQDIKKGTRIIEYIGQKISKKKEIKDQKEE